MITRNIQTQDGRLLQFSGSAAALREIDFSGQGPIFSPEKSVHEEALEIPSVFDKPIREQPRVPVTNDGPEEPLQLPRMTSEKPANRTQGITNTKETRCPGNTSEEPLPLPSMRF